MFSRYYIIFYEKGKECPQEQCHQINVLLSNDVTKGQMAVNVGLCSGNRKERDRLFPMHLSKNVANTEYRLPVSTSPRRRHLQTNSSSVFLYFQHMGRLVLTTRPGSVLSKAPSDHCFSYIAAYSPSAAPIAPCLEDSLFCLGLCRCIPRQHLCALHRWRGLVYRLHFLCCRILPGHSNCSRVDSYTNTKTRSFCLFRGSWSRAKIRCLLLFR